MQPASDMSDKIAVAVTTLWNKHDALSRDRMAFWIEEIFPLFSRHMFASILEKRVVYIDALKFHDENVGLCLSFSISVPQDVNSTSAYVFSIAFNQKMGTALVRDLDIHQLEKIHLTFTNLGWKCFVDTEKCVVRFLEQQLYDKLLDNVRSSVYNQCTLNWVEGLDKEDPPQIFKTSA